MTTDNNAAVADQDQDQHQAKPMVMDNGRRTDGPTDWDRICHKGSLAMRAFDLLGRVHPGDRKRVEEAIAKNALPPVGGRLHYGSDTSAYLLYPHDLARWCNREEMLGRPVRLSDRWQAQADRLREREEEQAAADLAELLREPTPLTPVQFASQVDHVLELIEQREADAKAERRGQYRDLILSLPTPNAIPRATLEQLATYLEDETITATELRRDLAVIASHDELVLTCRQHPRPNDRPDPFSRERQLMRDMVERNPWLIDRAGHDLDG